MKKSVICAIVKNEQRFIREWVEHYLNIGFNKLYIFEDYDSDSHREQLADLIEDDKVELNNLEDTKFVPNNVGLCAVQVPLYCKFFDMCKKKEIDADWVGFFDVDEFLMFEDGWNLNRLEEEFKDYGGILLSWLMYGANGHIKRPEGNVVDNYTSHLPKNTYIDSGPQWNHKSLVNIKISNGLITNHTFNGCVHTNGNGDYAHSPQIYEKAWINHYFTKSWEDYCDRMFNRGNMRNNRRCFDYFFFLSPELQDRKIEMLESVRYMKTVGTMWISHEQRIISGGNMKRLEKLRKGL